MQDAKAKDGGKGYNEGTTQGKLVSQGREAKDETPECHDGGRALREVVHATKASQQGRSDPNTSPARLPERALAALAALATNLIQRPHPRLLPRQVSGGSSLPPSGERTRIDETR